MAPYSTPAGAPIPCWHCLYFDRMVDHGTAALCRHPDCVRVRSGPANGCSCWERVPGVDDEPEPPSVAARAGVGTDCV